MRPIRREIWIGPRYCPWSNSGKPELTRASKVAGSLPLLQGSTIVKRDWAGLAVLSGKLPLTGRGDVKAQKAHIRSNRYHRLDISKTTFHLIDLDTHVGAIVMRINLSRNELLRRLANLRPCLIGLEAGSG